MSKLRRVYEMAEEEGRSVDDVGVERFSTLEEFREVQEERRILDEREREKSERRYGRDDDRSRDRGRGGETRYMFNDFSGPPSRAGSFRRPQAGGSTPSTPNTEPRTAPMDQDGHLRNKNLDRLRSSTSTPQPRAGNQPQTVIPSVITPLKTRDTSMEASQDTLSTSDLNKLQAKALRAKLMNAPNAAQLQEEYERALEQANSKGRAPEVRTEALPTLDAQGRMYDVGQLGRKKEEIEDEQQKPGNKRKKKEEKVLHHISLFTLRFTHGMSV
jgi:hypothetical protein